MFVTVDGRWQVYYLAVMCSRTRLDHLASLPNVVRMLARTHEFFGTTARVAETSQLPCAQQHPSLRSCDLRCVCRGYA